MSKRPNLTAVVEAAGSTRHRAAVEAVAPVPAPAGPSTRRDTKQVAGHFPEAVSWQLRELALERRSTVQALLGEALNDLFQKYGKPEIAPVK